MKQPILKCTLLKSSIVAVLILGMLNHTYAKTWIEEAFDEMQTHSNVTKGSAFDSQAANGYSGGSLFMRSPQKRYQLIDFTPPNISSSCGGIDLHMGAFSFLSKEKFIEMLKSIASEAPAFAFKLALSTMSPEIDNIMTGLQKVALDINQFSINSCEVNRKLFGSLSEAAAKAKQHGASQFSKDFAANPYKSFFQADQSTKGNQAEANKLADSIVNKNPDNDAVKEAIEPGNMVWRALTKHASSLKKAEKELFISITGTVIFTKNPDPDGAPKVEYKVANVSVPELVGQISTLSSATTDEKPKLFLLQCLPISINGDGGDCLEMEKSTTPSQQGTLKAMVHERLMSIKTQIIAREKQKESDIKYTEMISIPIQRMMALGNNAQSMSLKQSLDNKAEDIAAAEVAAHIINEAISLVESVLTNQQAIAGGIQLGEIKTMQNNLKQKRSEVHDVLLTAYSSASNLGTLTKEIEAMERTFTAGLSSSVKGNLAFQSKNQ